MSPALDRARLIFDRPDIGTVEAAGREAPVFLHNLSTNDIRNLPVGQGCEAFLCTATAKVVSHLMVWRYPDEDGAPCLRLDVPSGQSQRVFQHLDRYLISEEVLLTDRTPEWGRIHLAGAEAAGVLSRLLGSPTELTPGQVRPLPLGEGVAWHGIERLGLPGGDLVGPRATLAGLWQRLLDAGAVAGDDELFEVLRIEAGQPVFGKDMNDSTFAPEVGRTAQAISYNKGCYLGQEPIVMARDRGMVQRTLIGLKVGPDPLPPGATLWRDGKEVGRITSSVRSPRLGCAIALGYARRGSQEAGMRLEADVGGTRLPVEVAGLPF